MKILLISTESSSHLLLATPVIRVLKTDLNADIYVFSQDKADILSENPYIKKRIDSNEQSEFRDHKFDYIIDFENSTSSKQTRKRFEGTLIVMRKSLKEKIQEILGIKKEPKKHIVDQYFDHLEDLKIKPDQLGLDFFISKKNEIEKSWLPESHQNGYAAVVINAPFETRKLPTDRLIELCDRINKPIILIGGEEDATVAQEVEKFFQKGSAEEEKNIENLNKLASIFNACGKFNLQQSAYLIKEATWVFSYDSLYMHIASAFNKRIFSIWGNTSPNEGLYPYHTKFTIFENKKINCRPCSSKGFSQCPKGHFKCMNDVTFDFYLPD